jgi:hypothetical protein
MAIRVLADPLGSANPLAMIDSMLTGRPATDPSQRAGTAQ